jgi:hypothetical protein
MDNCNTFFFVSQLKAAGLDISYKRRRVLWRSTEGSFEPSEGKLRSSFLSYG